MSNLSLLVTPDLAWEKHTCYKSLSYALGFVVILFEALTQLLFHKVTLRFEFGIYIKKILNSDNKTNGVEKLSSNKVLLFLLNFYLELQLLFLSTQDWVHQCLLFFVHLSKWMRVLGIHHFPGRAQVPKWNIIFVLRFLYDLYLKTLWPFYTLSQENREIATPL